MKNHLWKKRSAALLMAVLAGTMAATAGPAWADEPGKPAGKITIENAIDGETYTATRILTLESYDDTRKAYSYKANGSEWSAFLTTGAGKDFVSIDDDGYVQWAEGADAAVFAAAASEYAAEQNIAADASSDPAADGKAEISVKSLGWYLVSSSVGAVCSLDTAHPEATIREKNDIPTVDKTVKENSTGLYDRSDDANVGDTIHFKSVIKTAANAKNLKFHDQMSKGLTFSGKNTVKVVLKKAGDAGTTEADVSEENYTVTVPGIEEKDPCTFEIAFADAWTKTLGEKDEIVITYDAALDEDASLVDHGTPNKAKVTYGNKGDTDWSQTKTWTFSFDIFKYTMNGEEKLPLDGATFTLSDANKKVLRFKPVGGTTNSYLLTADTAAESSVESLTTKTDGRISLLGLDAGTYTLTETAAPAGYNRLSGPVAVVISSKGDVEQEGGQYANLELMKTVLRDGTAVTDSVNVENKTGSLLPSTGGMGTVLFTAAGALLTAGATAVLILRNRKRGA